MEKQTMPAPAPNAAQQPKAITAALPAPHVDNPGKGRGGPAPHVDSPGKGCGGPASTPDVPPSIQPGNMSALNDQIAHERYLRQIAEADDAARPGFLNDPTWCSIHDCEMKRRSKDGDVWHSHKTADGGFCRGEAHRDTPGPRATGKARRWPARRPSGQARKRTRRLV